VAIDEQRLRVRRSLEEKLGVEEASYLMDRPVGGWSELVTNHTLDLKFDVVDERFRAVDDRLISLEHRIDTGVATLRHELLGEIDRRMSEIDRRIGDLAWRVVTAVIAGMAVMATIFAGITAGLVLLLGP
jgi:hypothetical protein